MAYFWLRVDRLNIHDVYGIVDVYIVTARHVTVVNLTISVIECRLVSKILSQFTRLVITRV